MRRSPSLPAGILAAAVIWAAFPGAPSARAQQSYVSGDLQAGTSALGSGGVSGQLGFNRGSPWYLYGELYRTAVPEGNRNDATQFFGEGGYEGMHFGFAAHYGSMSSGDNPAPLSYSWAGGTVTYRFVPWIGLSTDQAMTLSREDRQAELKRMRREMNEAIPMAPLLGITLDNYNLVNPLDPLGGMGMTHVAMQVRWRVKPFWNFIPRGEFFEYSAHTSDLPGAFSYSSRALRLVRLGPDGPYSGAFGTVSASAQLYNEFRIVPLLTFSPAITVDQVQAPAGTGISLWIDFDRYVGDRKNWLVSPSYEHYLFQGNSYSFFMIRIRYEFNPPYLPSPELH